MEDGVVVVAVDAGQHVLLLADGVIAEAAARRVRHRATSRDVDLEEQLHQNHFCVYVCVTLNRG